MCRSVAAVVLNSRGCSFCKRKWACHRLLLRSHLMRVWSKSSLGSRRGGKGKVPSHSQPPAEQRLTTAVLEAKEQAHNSVARRASYGTTPTRAGLVMILSFTHSERALALCWRNTSVSAISPVIRL